MRFFTSLSTLAVAFVPIVPLVLAAPASIRSLPGASEPSSLLGRPYATVHRDLVGDLARNSAMSSEEHTPLNRAARFQVAQRRVAEKNSWSRANREEDFLSNVGPPPAQLSVVAASPVSTSPTSPTPTSITLIARPTPHLTEHGVKKDKGGKKKSENRKSHQTAA